MQILRKVILVLLVGVVALTALGLVGPKVASFWRDYQFNRQVREAEEMKLAIETAYKNDRDGGKTPEETLDMFIAALKMGNTLQASKYYELSVQPKALNSLQAELAKNGNLKKSIDYFTEVRAKGVKQCNERGDGCTFVYRFLTQSDETVGVEGRSERFFIPAGSEDKKSVNISLNESSIVWKITQPF